MMNQISILVLIMLTLITFSCSTYEKNGNCYNYKPLGCISMSSSRLVCEINSEGCETCTCVPQYTGKELPLNQIETQ